MGKFKLITSNIHHLPACHRITWNMYVIKINLISISTRLARSPCFRFLLLHKARQNKIKWQRHQNVIHSLMLRDVVVVAVVVVVGGEGVVEYKRDYPPTHLTNESTANVYVFPQHFQALQFPQFSLLLFTFTLCWEMNSKKINNNNCFTLTTATLLWRLLAKQRLQPNSSIVSFSNESEFYCETVVVDDGIRKPLPALGKSYKPLF